MTDENVPKRIAIDVISNSFNAFSGLFTQAVVDTGVEVAQYKPLSMRELKSKDAVLFHWPNQFMDVQDFRISLGQLLRILILQRTHGLKLIWVAHNLAPHDSRKSSWIRDRFLAALDGILYLSHRSRELVHRAYRLPDRVVEKVTVHGLYPCVITPLTTPAPSERVRMVSIGLVRPYKNLGELVDAAQELDPREIEIAIVGKRHDPAYAARLEASAAPEGALRFELRDGLLSQAEIDATIDAAHGVVLPYRDILNSGSAIHALSRGRPVLVPALGSMPELAQVIGTDWVQLYDGKLTGSRVEQFASHLRNLPTGTQPDLSALAWNRVTEDLQSFFEQLFNEART